MPGASDAQTPNMSTSCNWSPLHWEILDPPSTKKFSTQFLEILCGTILPDPILHLSLLLCSNFLPHSLTVELPHRSNALNPRPSSSPYGFNLPPNYSKPVPQIYSATFEALKICLYLSGSLQGWADVHGINPSADFSSDPGNEFQLCALCSQDLIQHAKKRREFWLSSHTCLSKVAKQ